MHLIRELIRRWRVFGQLRSTSSGMMGGRLSMDMRGSLDGRLHRLRSEFAASNRPGASERTPAPEPHPHREHPSPPSSHNEVPMDAGRKIELIRRHAGHTFRTKKGEFFVYEMAGEAIRTNRTDYTIPLSDLCKALELVPFEGPAVIHRTTRGAAYVWAILHDARISEGHW